MISFIRLSYLFALVIPIVIARFVISFACVSVCRHCRVCACSRCHHLRSSPNAISTCVIALFSLGICFESHHPAIIVRLTCVCVPCTLFDAPEVFLTECAVCLVLCLVNRLLRTLGQTRFSSKRQRAFVSRRKSVTRVLPNGERERGK